MATRDHRLAEFNKGPPPPNNLLQVLTEDHSGTYVLPFPCERGTALGITQKCKGRRGEDSRLAKSAPHTIAISSNQFIEVWERTPCE
jgi:hypothetical protein